jgi:EAL domain-containing protein (putative c-di-GMP-specific phosphodiesterase class I)
VRDLGNSPNARAISQCFVSVAMAMGMEVIAEGVETKEQHQVLLSQGCHLIQGYFTGRPMKADALLDWYSQIQPTMPH